MNCPSCAMEMEERSLPKKLGGSVTVDVCRGCNGIWFDYAENLQLAPEGTIELFKLVHSHGNAERSKLAEKMSCPRCTTELLFTHDQVKNTKFSYFRCDARHGRFITFFQFLREKNFVRQLTPKQLNELKAKVRVINCSNCGAPVELERQMKCGYCDCAISVIDPDQIRKTIEELQGSRPAKDARTPEQVALELQLERMKVEALSSQLDQARGFGYRNDLVDLGLSAVGALLRGILS